LNWASGKGKLAIIGGIMINSDGVGTDRFMPLRFEIRTPNGTVDCYDEAFGKCPVNINRKCSSATLCDVRQSIESI